MTLYLSPHGRRRQPQQQQIIGLRRVDLAELLRHEFPGAAEGKVKVPRVEGAAFPVEELFELLLATEPGPARAVDVDVPPAVLLLLQLPGDGNSVALKKGPNVNLLRRFV